MLDVVVVGAGPAGVMAALRAAELGAKTALVTRDAFGGMAANDGPIPVRTLAHAARLIREARQLGQYGVAVHEPSLDYPQLLRRVSEVVSEIGKRSAFRTDLERLGVTIHEHAGTAHFVNRHTIEANRGLRLEGKKIILCAGGSNRRLSVPGSEMTAHHGDAWNLESVPPSILVIGAGATGAQVASIFNAFGSRITLYEAGPRILPTEDEDVSTAVATAFRDSGIIVRENFGKIDHFEKTSAGVRMVFSKDGAQMSDEAAVVIVAIGWLADTAGLNLATAGIETNARGYVRVDAHLRTSTSHIFAAGDITGRLMLVPQATQDGYVAATNAVQDATMTLESQVNPIGSFTDPEYAQVGITEVKARAEYDVVVSRVPFDSAMRPIIDGRTAGFCKLIVDRKSRTILGCHIVGERAVEIIQMAAIAMASGFRVDDLARIPLSFPTYTGVLWRAAYFATSELRQSKTEPRGVPGVGNIVAHAG